MKESISLCMPYYMNPGMLAEHYRQWAAWPDAVKRRVEVVLVDDASPSGPALDVERPADLPAISIYRVAVDIPWHQDGARNLSAHVAAGRWLVLTDMDHMLRADDAVRLLDHIDSGRIDDGHIYTLGRRKASNRRPTTAEA